MMIPATEIGDAIRSRRCELGLTQEKLAERIGVTGQQVQRYEYGKSKLCVDKLLAIAKALDVPTSYFLGDYSWVTPESPVSRMGSAERTLVERFRKIKNDKVRDLVVNLLKHAADEDAASL